MKIVRTAFSLVSTVLLAINMALIAVDTLLFTSFIDLKQNPQQMDQVTNELTEANNAVANSIGRAAGIGIIGVLFVVAEIICLIFGSVNTTFNFISRARSKTIFSKIRLFLSIILLIAPVVFGVLGFVVIK